MCTVNAAANYVYKQPEKRMLWPAKEGATVSKVIERRKETITVVTWKSEKTLSHFTCGEAADHALRFARQNDHNRGSEPEPPVNRARLI
jgi:hypothetical protein